jgi:hypothetical protein
MVERINDTPKVTAITASLNVSPEAGRVTLPRLALIPVAVPGMNLPWTRHVVGIGTLKILDPRIVGGIAVSESFRKDLVPDRVSCP